MPLFTSEVAARVQQKIVDTLACYDNTYQTVYFPFLPIRKARDPHLFLSEGHETRTQITRISNHVCDPNFDDVHVRDFHYSRASSAIPPQESVEVVDSQFLDEPGLFSCSNISISKQISEP